MRRLAALAIALAGCSGPSDGVDAGVDAPPEIDAGFDAGREPDVCDELGLGRTPFRTSGHGTLFGDYAGDFTARTLDGEFVLSERWSGCESYVFFVHFPGRTEALFATYPDDLFLRGPRNVRYFFVSDGDDAATRMAFAENLRNSVNEGLDLGIVDDADRAFWRERFHFVTDRARDVEGSVGALLRDYLAWAATPEAVVDMRPPPLPYAFAIDRAQELDAVDNLTPSVVEPAELGMAMHLGGFYDYRAALEARLATEAATEIPLVDERTTLRTFVREVTLPDAATMATFDSLEIDVEITCDHRNPFACSEWDRIADVQLCVDGMACTDRREIARWITPYWRRGRQHWLIDASPFLALLRAGGATHFFVELGPEWERATEWIARVVLRLRATGTAPRATGAELAFRGGAFDATYNTRPPFTFTPPATATRVELVTILSGHGQTMGDNCAEWCDHRHTFTINGTVLPAIVHEGAGIGSPLGCASRSDEGVIPGQWGNWAQARAYWCPGLPVVARRTDITSEVTLGAPNTLSYQGWLGTVAPRGGDIALSAYVVWY
jgi:hypothetical protein